MKEADYNEAKRLMDLIESFDETLDYFSNFHQLDAKEKIVKYFSDGVNDANKHQMALVMKNAVIESCELCLKEAREKFESL